MRNQPQPLAPADDARVSGLVTYLRGLRDDTVVTLTYVKRNGQKSSSTGFVGDFSGRPHHDTASVTILTADKGPRTINLVGVEGVLPHN